MHGDLPWEARLPLQSLKTVLSPQWWQKFNIQLVQDAEKNKKQFFYKI